LKAKEREGRMEDNNNSIMVDVTAKSKMLSQEVIIDLTVGDIRRSNQFLISRALHFAQ